jgi:hypothetical protein
VNLERSKTIGEKKSTAGKPASLTLPEAVCDSSPRQVIWRKLNGDNISRQDFDRILPHLSTGMGKYLMFVFQFHFIVAMGHVLNDGAAHLNGLFLGHDEFTSFTS